MSSSYEYSVGSVRAKEIKLLTNHDLDRAAALNSTAELCRFLEDKGYPGGSTPHEITDNHLADTWEYIRTVAPDYHLFEPFFIQNDIHNFKAVMKSTLTDRSYDGLIIKPSGIKIDDMVNAVEHGSYSLLPEWLAKSAKRAYEILTATSDARMSDAVLDTAAISQILDQSKKSGCDFLYNYFLTFAFYCNLKTAIRASRTGADLNFLNTALSDRNGLLKPQLIAGAQRGEDALLEAMSKRSEFSCSKAIEAYRTSPKEFEKYTDNLLIGMAKEECRRTSDGAAPLIGYLLAVMAEVKAINIIDVGIRTSQSTDEIKERLREIYG